ncbi:MAG: galactose mutarotase [Pirellulales bacterium]|nr:galactose mutarotase [Pirellulales bacterium]
MTMKETDWGIIDGKPVMLYTLQNLNGLAMQITNYGTIITSLYVPDRKGSMADIVLGYDTLDSYIAGSPYFGSIVGRCANRIAKGRFTLDGKTYQLAVNANGSHLHGGVKGFDKWVWDAAPLEMPEAAAIQFRRISPHGEENYPGNLDVSVTYALTDRNELRIEVTATTDAPTICNLTQHTYWNLAGHDSGTVRHHIVQFNADRYMPVDASLIPTGEIALVDGTPFDFRNPKTIGRDLERIGNDPQGYDHNIIPNKGPGLLRPFGRITEPESGRVMELFSNQPGCQFYTGNFLDGSQIGKGGAIYRQYNGFCLETQHYPDAIHHEGDWPSVILRPGETYHHLTIAKFSTRESG